MVATTAAEHAQGVLDAVERNPGAFRMSDWLETGETYPRLAAHKEPGCGTTMCVAGWTVHNAGYDIHYDLHGTPWARKGNEPARTVEVVAKELLGLGTTSLFYISADNALFLLRKIVAAGT